MDWVQAKIDYITNPKESYRSLAQRYGISVQMIKQRGGEEHWVRLRKEHTDTVCEKTVEAIAGQTVEAMAGHRMARLVRVQGAAEALLVKLEEGIRQVDSEQLIRNGSLPKGLAAAIRDIKEILELRCDADVREQEARIERLRSGLEGSKENGVRLVIDGGEQGWMQ